MPSSHPSPPPPSWSYDANSEPAALRARIDVLTSEVAVLRQTLAIRHSNTEATYRAVFDSVNEGIFIQDLDTGAIVDVSLAATNLSGYSRTELLGAPLSMLGEGQGEALSAPEGALFRQAMAGEPQQLEWTCKRKDGSLFSAEVTLKRVHLAGHERILGVVRDISERKARERLQEELIEAQAKTLAELSTPLIPISERVVVMPLIGTIDERRMQQVLETLVQGIARSSAHLGILDVTGVTVVNAEVADALVRVARTVRLLGARLMLTGIRPEMAQAIVGLNISLQDIETHGTLQAGIAAALR